MKNLFKKALCVLLAVLTVIACGITAFSADEKYPIDVTVTARKHKMMTFGVGKFDVKITNITDETVKNISALALFNDLIPCGNSTIEAEAEQLLPGESIEFSFMATISDKYLNWIQEAFLRFVHFFYADVNVIKKDIVDGRNYVYGSDNVRFGKFDAKAEVRVWYGEKKDQQNRPEQTNYEKYVGSIIDTGAYSVSLHTKQDGEDISATVYCKNGKQAFDTTVIANGVTLNMQIVEKDGRYYAILPSLRVYVEAEDADVAEIGDLLSDVKAGGVHKYIGTVNGDDYLCETYLNEENNIKYTYYFSDIGLTRIDTVNEITGEITSSDAAISSGADDSKFVIPSGYILIDSAAA